jgi:hypothetical protein
MGLWKWFCEEVIGIAEEAVSDAAPKIQLKKLKQVWELALVQADEERYRKNGWPKTAQVPEISLAKVFSADQKLRLEIELFYNGAVKTAKLSEQSLEPLNATEIYSFERSYSDTVAEYWYIDPHKVNQLISQLLSEAEAKTLHVEYT